MSHELVAVGEKKVLPTNSLSEVKVCYKPMMCTKHPSKKLKFFCDTCECLICRDCIVMEHFNHERNYPQVVAEREKESLHKTLKMTEAALVKMEDAISSRIAMNKRIKNRKDQVNNEIKQQFEKIYASLQKREQVLLSKCEKVANEKLVQLAMEIEEIETHKQKVIFSTQIASSAQDFMPEEILSTKKTIQDHLEKNLVFCSELELEPGENDDISVVLDTAALDKAISEFGSVSEACDPAQCTVEEGLVIPLATVEKEREVKVALNDSKAQMLCGKVPCAARLKAINDGSVLPVVVSHTDGRASLSFKPVSVGEHLLTIKVKNKQIPGSPYKIWSRQSRKLQDISSYKCKFSVGSSFYGVAVSQDGDVFASNNTDGSIQVFSGDGSLKHQIGSKGSKDGLLSKPRGLAIVEGVLYVVDNGNHRVQKFSLTGQYLGQFGRSGKAQFKNLCGICSDGKGRVLIADYDNKSVDFFATDGSFISSISCKGTPYDVAVDNNGNIHVTQTSANCVLVYSAESNNLISSYKASEILDQPTGIAVDENGYRYVGSYGNNRICIFSPTGELVSSFSTSYRPCCITLDIHGDFCVAFSGNGCVYKY